ncbi:hypothetical protein B0H14DRAFT_3426042 [Mycena olivaceomarginata]|nr:hypothetical protein B0H14DRAFT_3426042 [Mycena olivaceomarginata]
MPRWTLTLAVPAANTFMPPRNSKSPSASRHHFTSLVCCLGCIFAHAYFPHHEEFKRPEAESSLYACFLALTECFDLIPVDFLIIAPESRSELQQLSSPSDPEPTPPSPHFRAPQPVVRQQRSSCCTGPGGVAQLVDCAPDGGARDPEYA